MENKEAKLEVSENSKILKKFSVKNKKCERTDCLIPVNTLNQCRINVGPPSATLVQLQPNIGSTSRVYWDAGWLFCETQ